MGRWDVIQNLMASDIALFVVMIALAITFFPIFVGVLIALFVGATGLVYFSVVMTVAIVIWAILYLIWWL